MPLPSKRTRKKKKTKKKKKVEMSVPEPPSKPVNASVKRIARQWLAAARERRTREWEDWFRWYKDVASDGDDTEEEEEEGESEMPCWAVAWCDFSSSDVAQGGDGAELLLLSEGDAVYVEDCDDDGAWAYGWCEHREEDGERAWRRGWFPLQFVYID